MKRVTLGILICTLLVLVGVQSAWAAPAASACQQIHIVRRGENLYRISLRYGTTVKAIALANGIANPSRIYARQRLVIPCGSTSPPSGRRVYIVRYGDMLYGIARRFGVPMYTIVRANNIKNPNRIYAGQRLVIPGGARPPSTGVWYTVRRGDTLSSIAWHFGMNMRAIARANNIANLNLIYTGQRLYIP